MVDEKKLVKSIKDVEGGAEIGGELTVKEGLYAEKNLSVGTDLDVAGRVNLSGIQLKVAEIPASLRSATESREATEDEAAWIKANYNAAWFNLTGYTFPNTAFHSDSSSIEFIISSCFFVDGDLDTYTGYKLNYGVVNNTVTVAFYEL